VHETITFLLLLVTLPNVYRFKKKSLTDSAINLSTTSPHLQYVAILPCNLSLMVCFADINVSQGSVATYARCGEIVNIHLTTNLLRNLPVKKIKLG